MTKITETQKLTIQLNIPGDISHKINQYDAKIEETMEQINALKDACIDQLINKEEIEELKEFLKDLKYEIKKLKKHQSQHIEGRNNLIKWMNRISNLWF